MLMPAVSIVLLNQKGGVGKTSTCHHLAGTLAKEGKRILLVDNDPQASLTQGLFGPQVTRDLDPGQTVAAVYADNAVPEQVIHRTEIPGIDLVPGSRHAMKYNNAEPWAAGRDLQIGLREVVEAVRDRYDMVLIDCPPNLHLCSWAALVASDFLIVPLQPEDYGAQGIIDVQESVALVTELANPGLSLLGYLITMFNAPQVDPQDVRGDAPQRSTGTTSSPRVSLTPPSSRRRSPFASRSPSTSPRAQPPRRSRRWPTRSRRGSTPAMATWGRLPDEQARRIAPRGRRQCRREHGGRGCPPVPGGRQCRSAIGGTRYQDLVKAKNAFEVPDRQDRARPQPAAGRSSRPRIAPGSVRFDSLPGPPATDPGALGRGTGEVRHRRRRAAMAGRESWRARRRSPASSSEGEMTEIEILHDQLVGELPPRRSPAHRAGRGVPQPDGCQELDRPARLAEELHIRDSTVFKALALLELPGEVRERVAAGEIKPATAYALSQLDSPQDQVDAGRAGRRGEADPR